MGEERWERKEEKRARSVSDWVGPKLFCFNSSFSLGKEEMRERWGNHNHKKNK